MKQRNIMIDIETWSTKPNAAIRSIAAVEFDIDTGVIGDKFYTNVSKIHNSVDFDFDKETELWWASQSKESQKIFDDDQINIRFALYLLNEFIEPNDIIWSNSPSFDCVILRDAMDYFNIIAEWEYYNERCVRTIVNLNKKASDIPFEGIKHYAIDDCIHQIKRVCAVLKTTKCISCGKNTPVVCIECADKNASILAQETAEGAMESMNRYGK